MAGLALPRGPGSGSRRWATRFVPDGVRARAWPVSRFAPSNGRWLRLDWILFAAVTLVSALGVVMVYSATRGPEPPYDDSFLVKQAMFVGLGALAMAATVALDGRRLRDLSPLVYGLTTLALVAVVLPGIGATRNGTQGWFVLGPLQVQPSELAKIGLIMGVADLAARSGGRLGRRRLALVLAAAAVPIGLVLLQPDLGTTLVSGCITLTLVVVAGASGRQLALLGAAAAVTTVLVLQSGALGDYQRDRLTSFLDQGNGKVDLATASSSAYNLEQAKITIGSGGWTGTGLFEAPQTRLRNVPFQHTDFIFTAVGEQLGLLGGASLLGLFSVIVWRVWRTAQRATDLYGSLVCVGVLAMLVFQIFENVGMTMGIMPITGIPLPFMSYGGSSTITNFVAVGLVANVRRRRCR